MKDDQFETILLKAIAGDHDAVEKILEKYKALIDRYSIIDGKLDEDCRQYILLRISLQIGKFNIQE